MICNGETWYGIWHMKSDLSYTIYDAWRVTCDTLCTDCTWYVMFDTCCTYLMSYQVICFACKSIKSHTLGPRHPTLNPHPPLPMPSWWRGDSVDGRNPANPLEIEGLFMLIPLISEGIWIVSFLKKHRWIESSRSSWNRTCKALLLSFWDICGDTVDGRKLAPVDMENSLFSLGIHIAVSQLVSRNSSNSISKLAAQRLKFTNFQSVLGHLLMVNEDYVHQFKPYEPRIYWVLKRLMELRCTFSASFPFHQWIISEFHSTAAGSSKHRWKR